ncbi:MAG TPA: immunoglobulin domain-containing protein [Rariglobus sp.]
MKRILLLLALAVPVAATAAVDGLQLVAGWDFGQFTAAGFATTLPTQDDYSTFIDANFSSTNGFNPVTTHDGSTPVSAGTGTINWAYDDAANGLIFSSAGSTTINTTMAVFAGTGMSNGNSDPLSLALGFNNFDGGTFSLTTNLSGYGDYVPADYAGAANFSFAAASEGAVTIDWYFGATLVGTNVLTAGTLDSFNTYTLDLPSLFYGSSGTLTAQVSGDATFTLDNVQINGVVVVPETPVITLQPVSQTVTAGVTVVLEAAAEASGTPSFTYQWRKDDQDLIASATVAGVNSPTLTLTNVSLDSAGSYSLRVTNTTVFTVSEPAVLTVHTVPEIILAPVANTANPGQTIVFTVEATGFPVPTYQWRKDGVDLVDGPDLTGSTLANLRVANITEDNAGDYTVVVMNAAGSIESSPVALTVTDSASAPVITKQPSGQTVVSGQSAVFQVQVTGAPAPTFQWRRNGVDLVDGIDLVGATSETLKLLNIIPDQAGTYTVVVSNSAGDVESGGASLAVLVPPSIPEGSGPLSQTVLSGGEVTFSVTASGTPAPTFQWKKQGEDIPGATQATLTLTAITLDDAGEYTVVVTNTIGSTESAVATLTVHIPPKITAQPAGRTVGIGATVIFSVSATGSPAPSYQWLKDGQEISGATADQYTIYDAQSTDSGGYSVRVSNTVGAELSLEVPLVVATQVLVNKSKSQIQSFSPGTYLLLQSDFTGSNSTYQWFLNGRPIPGATLSTYVVADAQAADAGSYSVKLYSQTGWNYATRLIARVAITVANTYNALLRDPVSDEPVGRLAVTINKTGAYSGRLLFEDGRSYALRGKFTFDSSGYVGTSVLPIKRAKGLGPLELVLSLDALAAELEAGLSPASNDEVLGSGIGVPQTASAAWQGTYTLTLAPTSPAADAITATAAIDAKGVLKLAGRTTDGQAFKVSVPGGIDGSYAIFVQLYGKSGGQLAGSLKLVEAGGAYAATPASSGLFTWFKPEGVGSVPGVIDLTFEPTLTP